jgi:hypothetical protein
MHKEYDALVRACRFPNSWGYKVAVTIFGEKFYATTLKETLNPTQRGDFAADHVTTDLLRVGWKIIS